MNTYYIFYFECAEDMEPPEDDKYMFEFWHCSDPYPTASNCTRHIHYNYNKHKMVQMESDSLSNALVQFLVDHSSAIVVCIRDMRHDEAPAVAIA